MQQVSQCQAADQDVWPVAHALILIDDPQKSGIPNNADDEHQAGHHSVDVLEGVTDFCGSCAHGRQPAAGHGDVGPHLTLRVPLYEAKSLRGSRGIRGNLFLRLQLCVRCEKESCHEEEPNAEDMSPHPGALLLFHTTVTLPI